MTLKHLTSIYWKNLLSRQPKTTNPLSPPRDLAAEQQRRGSGGTAPTRATAEGGAAARQARASAGRSRRRSPRRALGHHGASHPTWLQTNGLFTWKADLVSRTGPTEGPPCLLTRPAGALRQSGPSGGLVAVSCPADGKISAQPRLPSESKRPEPSASEDTVFTTAGLSTHFRPSFPERT